jgi:hypothetical protein
MPLSLRQSRSGRKVQASDRISAFVDLLFSQVAPASLETRPISRGIGQISPEVLACADEVIE